MKSVVSYPERGKGGSASYRGNCSPKLLDDIFNQYKIKNISDYMCGSNTTRDVAEKHKIISNCYDLHSGFNLMTDDINERNESIFWHPPYWDIIKYSDNMYSAEEVKIRYGFNPNEWDLSHCKEWDDFVKKMNYCCMKQFSSLERGGHMFVLMGDIKKQRKLYSMLLEIAKPGTIEQIIIKTQHNCFSDNTLYSNYNFVPIVHEYLLILRKDNSLFYEIQYSKSFHQDIRNLQSASWKDVVAAVMESLGKNISLSSIYKEIENFDKAKNNIHWKEKIRQTLQRYPDVFMSKSRGCWNLAG